MLKRLIIPVILNEYDAKDVFNVDETGLFYRATPDRTLILSKEQYKGGKKSKERFMGFPYFKWTRTEKLKPVVIGKNISIGWL